MSNLGIHPMFSLECDADTKVFGMHLYPDLALFPGKS